MTFFCQVNKLEGSGRGGVFMLRNTNIIQKVCLLKNKEIAENTYELAHQDEVQQATQEAIRKYYPVLKALA